MVRDVTVGDEHAKVKFTLWEEQVPMSENEGWKVGEPLTTLGIKAEWATKDKTTVALKNVKGRQVQFYFPDNSSPAGKRVYAALKEIQDAYATGTLQDICEKFDGTKVVDAEAAVFNVRGLRLLMDSPCDQDSARQLIEIPRAILTNLGGDLVKERVVQTYCKTKSCLKKVENCSCGQKDGTHEQIFLNMAEIGDTNPWGQWKKYVYGAANGDFAVYMMGAANGDFAVYIHSHPHPPRDHTHPHHTASCHTVSSHCP